MPATGSAHAIEVLCCIESFAYTTIYSHLILRNAENRSLEIMKGLKMWEVTKSEII